MAMPTKRTDTNVTVSVSMTPAMAAAVASRAEQDGVKSSEIVRRLIAKGLRLPKSASVMGKAGRPQKTQ